MSEWAEVEYERRKAGMRPEVYNEARRQYATIASLSHMNKMQVNELAYGVAPNDAGNHLEDYQREPLANYVVCSPYLASLRWRDFVVQREVKGLLRNYRRINESKDLASQIMARPMDDVCPLVIRPGAGALPEFRKFNFSPDDLSHTRLIACDEYTLPVKFLNMMFRYDMARDLYLNDNPDAGLVRYTNQSVDDLLNEPFWRGKADMVILNGLLDDCKNVDAQRELVRKALYLLRPEGMVLCDFPLMTAEVRRHADYLAIRKPLRLRKAKNILMQICADIGATATSMVSPREEALLLGKICPDVQNLDYRIGSGLENVQEYA